MLIGSADKGEDFKITLFITIFVLFSGVLLVSVDSSSAFKVKGGEIHTLRANSSYLDLNYTIPEYLSSEDLVFYTCIEENTSVVSSVLCLDDTSFEDIDLMHWNVDGENCYIGSYDLEKKTCTDIEIQSYYKRGDDTVTLSQPIRVNRFSSILDVVIDGQYSDGGWKTALDTAAGVWILSNYKDIFDEEIEYGIDWLKEYRDNAMKCWPAGDCSVRTTANILTFLTLAEVDDKKRVIHDGIEYLHYMQNFYMPDDIWKLTVRPLGIGRDENVSCIISYNRSNLFEEPFLLNQSTVLDYDIDVYPNEKFYVICDGNFYANLTTQDDESVFVYEGDNLTYTLPYACWSKDNKWGKCDIMTTEFAMMSNLTEDSFDQAFYYLNSELYNDRTHQKYVGKKKNITESSLYLYLNDEEIENIDAIARSEDLEGDAMNKKQVMSWVRFKQNNNGSWGNGSLANQMRHTGYSIISLMKSNFSRNHEVIEDAERWISDMEIEIAENKTGDYNGFNKTELDALAFVGLKNNIRPFLKSTPHILVVDKEEAIIEVYNPTTFDLEDVSYEFSENLKDIIDIEEREELDAYSYSRLTVKRAVVVNDTINGYLNIYNLEENIATIPIMVVNYPKFEVKSLTDDLIVFGTTSRIELNINKSEHPFECDITWDHDDISSKNRVTFSKEGSNFLDISFKEAERVERVYFADFSCIPTLGVEDTFRGRIRVDVSRYPKFPFEVVPSDLIFVNSSYDNPSIIVKNNLDESINIKVQLEKDSQYFKLSKDEALIEPSGEVNITIFNTAPNENLTRNNAVIVSALGEEKKVQFRAMLIQETKVGFKFAAIIALVVVIFAIGIGGYLLWQNRDQLSLGDLLKGKIGKGASKKNLLKIKIKKYEEKERRTAVINMMKIMRMLNKSDKEIRERLVDEGFTEEQIEDAIKAESDAQAKLMDKKKKKADDEKK